VEEHHNLLRGIRLPRKHGRAGILPLITAPVVANMRLHHVLIGGGVGLNIISHAAFKEL
jgi:hypothetical protein